MALVQNMPVKLYCFWLGDNPLSPARRSALSSLENTGLQVAFLRETDLGCYIGESDLHPAYWYLSDNHKSDYLRALFMHRFGGGYADLKWIERSWLPELRRLQANERLLGSGYRESDIYGVANNYLCERLLDAPRWRRLRAYFAYRHLRRNYRHLIGNGAFLFKPRTELTARWWATVNARLDFFHDALARRPARYPREGKGMILEGEASDYPVPWIYLCGSILHPLAYRYRDNLSKDLPPLFYNTPEHATYL